MVKFGDVQLTVSNINYHEKQSPMKRTEFTKGTSRQHVSICVILVFRNVNFTSVQFKSNAVIKFKK